MTCTDHLERASNSLNIRLENANNRWISPWYPQHGNTFTAHMGYTGSPLLTYGVLEINEIELESPPRYGDRQGIVCQGKALGIHVQSPPLLKTTLQAIARDVVRRNKMELMGKFETVQIQRATQVFESDLAFLRRLADEYGATASMCAARSWCSGANRLYAKGKPCTSSPD